MHSVDKNTLEENRFDMFVHQLNSTVLKDNISINNKEIITPKKQDVGLISNLTDHIQTKKLLCRPAAHVSVFTTCTLARDVPCRGERRNGGKSKMKTEVCRL